jgi:hypothetical protein
MRKNIKLKSKRAQTYPVVLLIAFILSLFATTILFLFRQESKSLIKTLHIMQKDELATIGLEHALGKLQQGSNWFNVPLAGFKYDKEYNVENIGYYSLYIVAGNLFYTNISDPSTRQGQTEYRTIGIKVKITRTADTHQYYAVVKKTGYGGPLISKGKINLPANNNVLDSNGYSRYSIFWGDIYSANPNDGYCSIPIISDTQKSGVNPDPWMPQVYAKGNIYTAVGATGGFFSVTYSFAYVYDDMSPTAHSHPYSEFAKAPDLALEAFKKLAYENNAYYGPVTIGGDASKPNPYFINDGLHDLSDLYASPCSVIWTVVKKLSSAADTVFIDTSDALPLTKTGTNTWNTYTGKLLVTESANTLKLYVDANEQFSTFGYLFVMGPLQLIGASPAEGLAAAASTPPAGVYIFNSDDSTANDAQIDNVIPPDNYYYPQASDGRHYYKSGNNTKNWYLYNIKHAGFLYTAGELKIGGPRASRTTYSCVMGSSGATETNYSDICIYGTVYIDEYGVLSIDTTNDNPYLYIYYNPNMNIFGNLGDKVSVMSFGEYTYLIPTPVPEYPTF